MKTECPEQFVDLRPLSISTDCQCKKRDIGYVIVIVAFCRRHVLVFS